MNVTKMDRSELVVGAFVVLSCFKDEKKVSLLARPKIRHCPTKNSITSVRLESGIMNTNPISDSFTTSDLQERGKMFYKCERKTYIRVVHRIKGRHGTGSAIG